MKNPQKAFLFTDLTQNVNIFSSLPQLQKIQFYSNSINKYWFILDFYPSPRRLLFFLDSGKPSLLLEAQKEDWSPRKHPIDLYLRAHFKAHRVVEAVYENQALVLRFSSQREFCFDLQRSPELIFKACVEGRRDFVSQIEVTSPYKVQEASRRQKNRYPRLLENVRSDLQSAEDWLKHGEPLAEELSKNPVLWEDPASLTFELREWIKENQVQGQFPDFGVSQIGRIQDVLFAALKRQRRKKEKAGQRLEKLLQEKGIANQRPPTDFSLKKKEKNQARGIAIAENVLAYVGRNSRENDQLLRRFASNDLWFHARAIAGSHVWLPRHQKGLPNKGSVPRKLIEKAAQLALFHSKSRKSAAGEVEYTEKRYLRRIKGEPPSKLRVTRSESIFVRLDEEFERNVLGR